MFTVLFVSHALLSSLQTCDQEDKKEKKINFIMRITVFPALKSLIQRMWNATSKSSAAFFNSKRLK